MPLSKVNAFANQKGGVSKTTTAIKLSSALGILEQNVLLVDGDPQANTTLGLGFLTKDIEYFKTIINLSEAPSFGTSVFNYKVNSAKDLLTALIYPVKL